MLSFLPPEITAAGTTILPRGIKLHHYPVLVLYVQDEVFDLERKLVGVAIRTSASVREPLHAVFLITIEDLIAGLAGDAKLPAKFRHRLALTTSPSTGRKCHLCVRYNVLPMSQVAHCEKSLMAEAYI